MIWRSPSQQPQQPEESSAKQTHVSGANGKTSPPFPVGAEDALAARTNTSATDSENQAYKDLKQFLTFVDPEAATVAESTAKDILGGQAASSSDSIYPSQMSCSNCFDQAFYCSSAVGQLNNIYRYGGLRSCSDLWAQWRFCMRTKAMTEDMKNTQIRDFNKQKATKYKTGPSSEDIWETRKELIENAFTNVL